MGCGSSDITSEGDESKGGGTEVVAEVPLLEVLPEDSMAWEIDIEASKYYKHSDISELSAKLELKSGEQEQAGFYVLFSWKDSIGLHSAFVNNQGELWVDTTFVGSFYTDVLYTWKLKFTENYASLHLDDMHSFLISTSGLEMFRAEAGLESNWYSLSFNSGPDTLNVNELKETTWFDSDIEVSYVSEPLSQLTLDTVTLMIQTGSDDAEEDSLGTIDLVSKDLDLLTDFAADQDLRAVGIRFASAGIPQGAKIYQASLRMVAQDTGTLITELRVCSEWSGNSLTFSYDPENISSRPLGFDCLFWGLSPWVSGEVRYVNLKAPAQVAVMHPDWTVESAMTFIFEGYGSRDMVSYDRSPTEAPQLTVIYSK